jgi:hypothetical protein
MPQSDHLKLQRGPATNAKREERGNGGEKGDHGRMCHDDYAKNLWYLRHLRVLSRHTLRIGICAPQGCWPVLSSMI